MEEKYKTKTISIADVIEKFKNYDASEEAKEPILYFVSELTGISEKEISKMTKYPKR